MNVRDVPVGRAVAWLGEGARLLGTRPAVFLAIALLSHVVDALLDQAGVFGYVARMVIAPALLGGFVFAIHEQVAGRGARVEHLLRGLQERPLPLLQVGLALLAAGAVVALLGVMLVNSEIVLFGSAPGSPAPEPGTTVGLAVLVVLSVPIVVGALVVTAFAPARIMLDGRAAWDAMPDGIAAVRASPGAVLLFAVAITLAAIVAALLLMVPHVGGVLSPIAAVLVSAVSTCGTYAAYRDLFPTVDEDSVSLSF